MFIGMLTCYTESSFDKEEEKRKLYS